MEESMRGSLAKSERAEQNIYGSWGVRLLAIPVLLLTALIGYVVSHPAASNWILQAVQPEFAGAERMADTTQVTKPDAEIRTKAH
jgi:hypothetical protein